MLFVFIISYLPSLSISIYLKINRYESKISPGFLLAAFPIANLSLQDLFDGWTNLPDFSLNLIFTPDVFDPKSQVSNVPLRRERWQKIGKK
jgi:hypothetical protein